MPQVIEGSIEKMILAHKIQLRPTVEQATAFAKACGCARFTYNWALDEYKRQLDTGRKPNLNQIKKDWNAIKGEKFAWIYESPKDANQYPFMHLKRGFSNFFKKTAKFPTFKKKGVRDSFTISNDKFSVIGNTATLPRIGKVNMTEPLRFKGKIMSGTVSRVADRWFLSIQVDVGDYAKPRTSNGTMGVDMGLATTATLSTGEKHNSPLPLKRQLKKLRRQSRRLSKKQKGSKNREKQKLKLSRLHFRIACIRKDWQHKFTTWLCRENQAVAIEDLSLSGMVRLWGRKMSDIGLYEIRRQLAYKSRIYGTDLVVADRWYPSSQLCFACGKKNKLTLADRRYHCSCGYIEDRDVNAAKNLHTLVATRGIDASGQEGSGSFVGETGLGEGRITQVSNHNCSLRK